MSNKTYTNTGINLPNEVWEQIVTKYAQKWHTNRSATILRIILEWNEIQDSINGNSVTTSKELSTLAA